MVFKIGGSGGLDIVPYAATGGISWKQVPIKGGNDTITADGTVYEDIIGWRYEWAFKFKPMTAAALASLLNLLNSGYLTVQYTDPVTNALDSASYYVSGVPAGYLVKRQGGTEYWGGMAATFTSQPPR